MEYTDGMIQVGNCYFQGIGVEKDEHQAFTWYKKLA
jgi:TPR repeat protein